MPKHAARFFRRWSLAFAAAAAGLLTGAPHRVEGDPPWLSPGAELEGPLAPGETARYRLRLAAGDYLRLAVEVLTVEARLTLTAPDGRTLLAAGLFDDIDAAVPLATVVNAPGVYRLELRGEGSARLRGRYRAAVTELRPSVPGDRQRLAADRVLSAGTELYRQQEAEQLKRAGEAYAQALARYQAIGDASGELAALRALALVHKIRGDQPRAVELYGAALAHAERIGDRRAQTYVLQSLGWLYNRLGRRDDAVTACQRALSLARASGDRRGEAFAYDKLGQIHRRSGELSRAIELYSRALAIYDLLGDHYNRAVTLANRAVAHQHLGELQQTLRDDHRALEIARQLGELRSQAVIYNNLGNLYHELADPAAALSYCRRALDLFRQTGDQRFEAQINDNCGMFLIALGRPRDALEYHRRSLALARTLAEREIEAFSLLHSGMAHRDLEQLAPAAELLDEALATFRALDHPRGEAMTLRHRAAVHRLRGELRRAEQLGRDGLAAAQRAGERRLEAEAHLELARVARAAGRLEPARAAVAAALAIHESSIVSVASPRLRTSARTAVRDRYELEIELLMQLHAAQPAAGHDRAALGASERARARSLLEMLQEAGVDVRRGVLPELLQHERALREQLVAAEQRRLELLARPPAGRNAAGRDSDEREATERALAERLAAYEGARDQIRAASPQVAALTQPEPLSASAIQERLLDRDTLLLEFALGRERSYLWALTTDALASFVLPPSAEIEAAARRVYELLTARNQHRDFETASEKRQRVRRADALYPAAAAELSRMLLSPVADLLGRRRLVIVAEGILLYLPFAALPTPTRATDGAPADGATEPLIEAHEIVYLPSASVLDAIRRTSPTPAAGSVAVLADPVFAADDPRVKKSPALKSAAASGAAFAVPDPLRRSARDVGIDRFARLPASRREAESIAALAGPRSFQALDFAATRELALAPELGRYRVVHFATHAVLATRHPDLSGLVLSLVDERGEVRNGFLRLHDVYNLELPAELVVLSACQTALGEAVRGEGLVGLTRGFLHAGAKAVVASLWSPEDQATAELMTHFYRSLLVDDLPAPAALRAAQLAMWREEAWRAPYFWAGFVLQGDWRARPGVP